MKNKSLIVNNEKNELLEEMQARLDKLNGSLITSNTSSTISSSSSSFNEVVNVIIGSDYTICDLGSDEFDTSPILTKKEEKEEDIDENKLGISEIAENSKLKVKLESIISIKDASFAYEVGDRIGHEWAKNSEFIALMRDKAKDQVFDDEKLAEYIQKTEDLLESSKLKVGNSTQIQENGVQEVKKNDQRLALLGWVKTSGVILASLLAGLFGFRYFRPYLTSFSFKPKNVDVAYRALEFYDVFFK